MIASTQISNESLEGRRMCSRDRNLPYRGTQKNNAGGSESEAGCALETTGSWRLLEHGTLAKEIHSQGKKLFRRETGGLKFTR